MLVHRMWAVPTHPTQNSAVLISMSLAGYQHGEESGHYSLSQPSWNSCLVSRNLFPSWTCARRRSPNLYLALATHRWRRTPNTAALLLRGIKRASNAERAFYVRLNGGLWVLILSTFCDYDLNQLRRRSILTKKSRNHQAEITRLQYTSSFLHGIGRSRMVRLHQMRRWLLR